MYVQLYTHVTVIQIYKNKATLCIQHATLLEASEDNKAQVLCVHFYQTTVLIKELKRLLASSPIRLQCVNVFSL